MAFGYCPVNRCKSASSSLILSGRYVQHIGRRQCLVADGVGDGEVAAGFGPFVVLLGQHRAHQVPRRQSVGADAHHVSPAPYLPVQPFLRVVGPQLLLVGHWGRP